MKTVLVPGSLEELDHKRRPDSKIKRVIIGEPMTELTSVIVDIPWSDAFTFGCGVDAITGNSMGSAIVPFLPTPRQIKSSTETYRFVQDESDLLQEIGAAASGSYNIQGVTVSAKSNYLNKVEFSGVTTSLIATYEATYDGYDEVDRYFLTHTAKNYINDPPQFRSMYGDYFVAGAKRVSSFVAVYTCTAQSNEDLNSFKAAIGASAPEVFSAEASASFERKAEEHHVAISVEVVMAGYQGVPPTATTPAETLKALEWFKEHEQGIYFQAKLYHYSMIDPTYPRTIGIDPQAFVDLRILYLTLWEIRVFYANMPSTYQTRYQSDFNNVDIGIPANQNVLATDQQKRDDFQRDANLLLSNIKDVLNLMDFYFNVKDLVSTEPKEGQKIEEDASQPSWKYGRTGGSGLTVNHTEEQYKQAYNGPGWNQHTFVFDDPTKLIVGWEVIANRNDGENGSWMKVVDTILLTSYASVHVTSAYDRDTDWSFRVYYVNAEDYPFGS